MAEDRTDAPRLAVEGIEVALGGRAVLRGLDLEVAAGETLTVLGPSGGGKTTLLRVVAGLTVPDRGRVLLDGVDVARVPAHRRGVGVMFQDAALWPHRDVGANVAFGLRMAGVPSPVRRRRVAEVLELVGLAGYQRRRVTELSGGEAQRVALARSLAPEPRVLCLDEPLGSLDRVLHQRLVRELRSLFDQLGLTVVHVTHDQQEALALADRLAVLSDGRILQAGSPDEVWRAPSSVEVARFLGHETVVPVTVEDGRVLAGGTVLAMRPGAPSGSAAMVVRSDAVRLTPVGEVAGHRARVVSTTFAGDTSVVEVAVAGWAPHEVVVRVRVDGAPPAPGVEVAVVLDGEACVLIPGGAPAQSPETRPTGQETPVPPSPQ